MTINKYNISCHTIIGAEFLCFSSKSRRAYRSYFVHFDASYSMTGRWESGRKIDRAKELLSNMVDSLKDIKNLEIGLRVYGHRSGYPPYRL